MTQKYFFLSILACTVMLAACTSNPPADKQQPEDSNTKPEEDAVATLSYQVIHKLPHDSNAFTEGLLWHKGLLYESTGAPDNIPQTQSMIGTVDPGTGRINIKTSLGRAYFGEGISFLNDRLYQLTYQNQLCFIYDAESFKSQGQFSFPSKEGWGMTTDGTSLIMSDGTNMLSYIDPATNKVTKTLQVSENHYALDYLNELEYINGYIYANIWMTRYVVKIDPATGKVVGKFDFTPLFQEAFGRYPGSMEMNGIAYNPENKHLYVTGKMWPYIFELSFTP